MEGYTKARLKGFYEEELDGLFGMVEEVPDHVLWTDRVVRRPRGHLLLLGVTKAGKTMLSWSDCADGKICFILNEPNVRDSGLCERMNPQMANGEGKEGAQRQCPMLDTNKKSSGWEEDHLHINVGLNKITETRAQVQEVQKFLADKSTKFEIKNKEAGKQAQQNIEGRQLLDTAKKAEVLTDMEQVEQAVVDAPHMMELIKKQYMVEGRSVDYPPFLIKMTRESAFILWGESSTINWKDTRDDPLRQEFRALEEAEVIMQSEETGCTSRSASLRPQSTATRRR